MIKTTLTAAALFLASALGVSAACSGHSDQAMTCADGTVYDSESNSCKTVSG
ncbi:adenylosuccinate lyase [Litorisediminicola beolgyonensis]|uniref:Adenylosuccinate lyase n=1 Tax=Litorisediminicola beolgyonensis TaxID=1173614 RepID=A0ABW3ZFD8_9RHOB